MSALSVQAFALEALQALRAEADPQRRLAWCRADALAAQLAAARHGRAVPTVTEAANMRRALHRLHRDGLAQVRSTPPYRGPVEPVRLCDLGTGAEWVESYQAAPWRLLWARAALTGADAEAEQVQLQAEVARLRALSARLDAHLGVGA